MLYSIICVLCLGVQFIANEKIQKCCLDAQFIANQKKLQSAVFFRNYGTSEICRSIHCLSYERYESDYPSRQTVSLSLCIEELTCPMKSQRSEQRNSVLNFNKLLRSYFEQSVVSYRTFRVVQQ